jgi:hypothetical protein
MFNEYLNQSGIKIVSVNDSFDVEIVTIVNMYIRELNLEKKNHGSTAHGTNGIVTQNNEPCIINIIIIIMGQGVYKEGVLDKEDILDLIDEYVNLDEDPRKRVDSWWKQEEYWMHSNLTIISLNIYWGALYLHQLHRIRLELFSM